MLRRLLYISIVAIMLPLWEANAQGVLIGRSDNAVNPYAKLEVYSTTSGLLIPRITQEEMEAINPDDSAISLLVFNTTQGAFMWFNGDNWEAIWSGDANLNIDDLIKDALKDIDAIDWATFQSLVQRFETDSALVHDSLRILDEKIITENLALREYVDGLIQQIKDGYVTNQALSDSLASLRDWITERDTIAQTSIVVDTITMLPAVGKTIGDVVIVKNNGQNYREVFIWSDINGDNIGESWESIEKDLLVDASYKVYWGKLPPTMDAYKLYEPATFNQIHSQTAKAIDLSGYKINTSEDYSGKYVFAIPEVWGRPHFTIQHSEGEFPVIDGMQMFPVTINNIKYNAWTLYVAMSSDYDYSGVVFKAVK